jgi:hypothetical protein
MRTTELYVFGGRVHCPRRGDIDIDRCFTCDDLRDYEVSGDRAVLRCTGRRPLAPTFPADTTFFNTRPF